MHYANSAVARGETFRYASLSCKTNCCKRFICRRVDPAIPKQILNASNKTILMYATSFSFLFQNPNGSRAFGHRPHSTSHPITRLRALRRKQPIYPSLARCHRKLRPHSRSHRRYQSPPHRRCQSRDSRVSPGCHRHCSNGHRRCCRRRHSTPRPNCTYRCIWGARGRRRSATRGSRVHS